ncbi:hypothetical protein E4U41_002427 [Claviceps citrina]|nr:hypothetical protein E4U41_002427 [Claviceps citrina]
MSYYWESDEPDEPDMPSFSVPAETKLRKISDDMRAGKALLRELEQQRNELESQITAIERTIADAEQQLDRDPNKLVGLELKVLNGNLLFVADSGGKSGIRSIHAVINELEDDLAGKKSAQRSADKKMALVRHDLDYLDRRVSSLARQIRTACLEYEPVRRSRKGKGNQSCFQRLEAHLEAFETPGQASMSPSTVAGRLQALQAGAPSEGECRNM